MKNIFRRISKLLALAFLLSILSNIPNSNTVSAQTTTDNSVPEYYYANYKFNDDWNAILKRFSEASAMHSMGRELETSKFVELSEHFDKVFPHLLEENSSVYQKCSILAKELSEEYSYSNMEALMGNSCQKSLMQVINKINSSYTVNPVASASPSNGMAPLTVTFDARSSTDPSQETIPANNFYWYYRDEKGVDRPIGEGQVLSYTFKEAGRFVVHLVVRSSNVDSGILDGEKNLTVNVTPKAADIVVYANTRRMTQNSPLKIGITEGEKGVVFDGTLTKARGGRKILYHRWTITNATDSFSYDSKNIEGNPSFINVPLKGKGIFKVTLSTTDNQNNTVSESYNIFLSDPVTVIKQSPEYGNTSTTFIFDGSASYSISNKINTYVREIFNDTTKNKVIMAQEKRINMNTNKAIEPGNYTVRLTVTDMAGNQNVETKDLYIESTTPEPQFTVTPTHKRKYPSEFTLDASNTMDNDVDNGVDSLSYSRRFSTDKYKIISSEKNNEKIVVQFDEIGKHTVRLTAIDQYGKFDSISKTIEVKSVLRPEIVIHPGPVHFGTNVDFESSVNKEVWDYARDFGDGTPVINSQQATNTNHIYGKRGIYSVQLTVSDDKDDTNTVTEKAFIGEIKQPIAAYRIMDDKGFYIQTSEICQIEGGEAIEAYSVNRYAKITINPNISVNTKGTSAGLQYVFEKESISGKELAKQVGQFSTSFSDVGCHYVDLSVKDSNVGKQDKVRIWFKVKNALPTIKNVTLTFPQYENNTSTIGFNMYNNNTSNNVQFDCSGSNNLTIKVTAVEPKDTDGNISRLRFYYYNVDDPDRILEYKEARASTPYAYFVIPRIAGEYKFGVMVYDNDGGMIDSEDYLAGNPSIYFPTSCGETGIPVVTLKVSSTNIQVGDSVEYSIISKISTNNDDFVADRTFYYDFNGDGVWDLTTKKDKVSYTFETSYEEGVTPRAAVEYRGKLGKADGPTILVRNGIRPVLLYNTIGNIVIFRDMSVGTIQQREICFETRECELGNNTYRKTHIVTLEPNELTGGTETSITKNDSFMWKYNNEGKHNVSIYLKNKYGIEVKTGFTVTTSLNSNNGRIAPGINMITIPEMTQTNGNLEIFLSKVMNNTLQIYVNNENGDTCYVDTDISTDSDGDGKSDNDMDIQCNKMAKIKYEPDYESAVGRLYFTNNGKLTFKNFYVTFEGIILELNEENKEIYNDITKLVNGIEDLSIENTDLKRSLDKLRKNLNNRGEVTSLVMLINEQLNEGVQITASQKDLLDSILFRLSNEDTVVSVGMNEYEKNKREILALLSEKGSLKNTVQKKFEDFEEGLGDYGLEDRKDKLEEIWDLILQENKKDKGNAIDEWILNNYFCNIYEHYDISNYTTKCGLSPDSTTISENYDEGKSKTETESQSSGLPMWLKIILIILVGGLLTMCGIIIFFSIKARLNSMSESDGDE